MRHRYLSVALAGLAVLALVGCSGGSGSTAPSVAPSTAPSEAASTAPSTEPSEAASAAPSDAPSDAVPSFEFPSEDKELEGLLPTELCGAKVTAFSMGGATFAEDADAEFLAILAALGKSTSDVSFAIAADMTGVNKCSAGIFRIKGADGDKLKEAFLAQAVKDGTTYTEQSIAGKTVYVDPDATSLGYAYFKGDAVIFAGADNADDAASIIAQLP